ncbi:MAG TPA: TolC family protein [Vicinamibacterales bacterium]|nr:TolC family protein [Vicinamibacterales bacterium]
MKKNVVMAAAAVLALAAGTPALAQTPAPAAIAPVQQPAPFVTPGPRVDLSIEEAVARAREKNIDIGVARITPRLTDFTIAGLEANYRPNLTSTIGNRSNTTAVTNQTQGGTGTSQHTGTVSWQSGFAQNMKWHGGSWNAGWTNSRVNTSNIFATRNPTYNSGLTANITQPLWRGWRIDTTRASLQTNRITEQNDEITLLATTGTTVGNTRNAYWDLVFAIQAVEAAQNSLSISNKLVQDNQARVEIGTLAPIDIKSAEAEAANRRLTLVQAQAAVRTAELALKRLIVSGTDDPLWSSSINPVDRPAATPEALNVDAAIARALHERTDLQQSMNNLRISDINLRNQVEATKPQLDFVASYGLSGVGGTQFVRGGLGGAVTDTIPSGYLAALRTLSKFDLPAWNVQVNFAVPLGQSTQEATVARSKLALEQTQANLKALQLQIATDVANAALTVQSSLEAVQQAAVARQLAQERLNAAQSKFEVGMAINYEVVQAQRDFLDAQNNELRAQLNYRKALVNFETVQTVGTRGVNAAVGGTTTGGAATGSTVAGGGGL